MKQNLKILEVNDIDLPGRRFNGYDLQKMINKKTNWEAKQIVAYKLSKNKNVLRFYKSKEALEKEIILSNNELDILSVHSQLSFSSNFLKENKYFKKANLVHYHLIHNSKLSLYKMIDLCNGKPSIISIHDPWIFTGRCVHPQNCEKWKNGCHNCQNLNSLFPLKEDNCNSLWKLKKKIYENLNVDFVVSTPFMLEMFKKSPLTKNIKNVHLIPFGVDLTKFNEKISKRSARKKLSINENDIVLFFRAQMAMKGTEYIIEALKSLKTTKKVTLLTCSGTGLLKSLEDKYTVLDLGHIDEKDLINAYRACDMFLMPSRGESFGLMAVEAMACSRPIIIFDNTALPYVTFAPECGVLVKDKDVEDLKNKIKNLIDDEEERKRRGDLGRKLAVQNYDVNVYNKKMLQLYEKVYSRQKEKALINYSEDDVDYSLTDVKILAKKLSNIYSNVFNGELINKSFLNYQQFDNIKNKKKIDYSIESVQKLIQQFNNCIFLEMKKRESLFYRLRNKKIWHISLKEKTINKLRNYNHIYKIVRFLYRKLKGILK